MPDPQYLSTDPNAGEYLSTDPNAGTPMTSTPTPQGGGSLDAIGRGLSGFWEQVNPVTIAQGLGQAVTHPIDTVKGIGAAQGELYTKAAKAFESGDYVTGARHAVNYLLPILGPALDAQSDKMMQGDIAGGVGGTVGIAANIAAPELAGGAVKTFTNAPRTAAALRSGANERITDVIKPTVGPNKVRFANNAAKVAPKLASEPGMLAWSREGLQTKLAERMEQVSQEFDALNTSRPPNQVIYTNTLEQNLQKKLDALKVNGVIPQPRQAQANVIKRAIAEVRKMGPVSKYEDLLEFRKSYDGPANQKYNPSLTADYLKVAGEADGAADVTSVIRDRMTQLDPRMKVPNAEYSWMRSAQKVMQAAEETDRARPKVGRQIMSRFGGTATGGMAGGAVGAAIGYVLAPIADSFAAMAPTTKIATARAMTRLADALSGGQATQAYLALQEVANLTGQGARLSQFVKNGLVAPPQMVPQTAEAQ